MRIRSIIFLLSQNLEDLQEERNYVHVENRCSQNVVVHLQLLVSSSHYQLSVHQQVNAVNYGEQSCYSHGQDAASDENHVDQTDWENNPEEAVQSSFSNKAHWSQIFFCSHCVVCQTDCCCQSCGSSQKDAVWSVHLANIWNQVWLTKSEDSHHNVVCWYRSAYFSEDWIKYDLQSDMRVTSEPMKASQKVQVLLIWNFLKLLEAKLR